MKYFFSEYWQQSHVAESQYLRDGRQAHEHHDYMVFLEEPDVSV